MAHRSMQKLNPGEHDRACVRLHLPGVAAASAFAEAAHRTKTHRVYPAEEPHRSTGRRL